MDPNQQTTQLDPQAVNLAKAIRQTESGGDFNAKGKSGEFGAYQFTIPTWTKTAQKYGVNVPLPSATKEQQNEVAYKQIKEWKDKGYNVGQIASMWNAGEGKPDAYLGGNQGVNKYGVRYDTSAYAKSVATAYQTLKNGGEVAMDPQNPSSISGTQTAPQEAQPSIGGFLGNVVSSGANLLGGVAHAVTHPIETGKNLVDLGVGGVENAIQGGANLLGIKGNGIQTPEMDKANAAAQFYKDRYGGADKIRNTLYKDPVGAAADASILLGGAGAALGKVGEVAELGNVAKVGSALSKAGELTNPLALPGKAVEGIASGLKKSAVGSYTDVLAPTGKADKFLTKGVVGGRDVTLPSGEVTHVPGLVERGVVVPSREALAEKVAQGLEDTGEKYKAAEASIPASAQVQAKPILDQIEQAKQQFIIKGNNGPVVADANAVKHLSDFQDTINQLTKDDLISRESLTRLKQLWQEKVAKAGGYYGKTLSEGSQVDMLSEAEHAIRNQLDANFPDVAKINAEYKFWKDAQKVITDTIQRKTGQSGFLRKGLSFVAGATAGAPFGLLGSGSGAFLAQKAMEVFSSPGWKTVSAVTKDRLANALVSGKLGLAGSILKEVGVPTSRANQSVGQGQYR